MHDTHEMTKYINALHSFPLDKMFTIDQVALTTLSSIKVQFAGLLAQNLHQKGQVKQ